MLIYKLQTSAYKFSWLLIPISIPFVWLLFPFTPPRSRPTTTPCSSPIRWPS